MGKYLKVVVRNRNYYACPIFFSLVDYIILQFFLQHVPMQCGTMHCPTHFFVLSWMISRKSIFRVTQYRFFYGACPHLAEEEKTLKDHIWPGDDVIFSLSSNLSFFYRLQLSLAATGFDYCDPSDLKIPREQAHKAR